MKFTELWVCAGIRQLTSGSAEAWHKLEGEGEAIDPETALYFPKGKGHSSIGGIYEVKGTRDGEQISMSRGPFVRQFAGKKLIAEWTAKADSARVVAKLNSSEKKLKDSNIIYDDVLAPFRRAYSASDPIGRQAILAKVISSIVKGRMIG